MTQIAAEMPMTSATPHDSAALPVQSAPSGTEPE